MINNKFLTILVIILGLALSNSVWSAKPENTGKPEKIEKPEKPEKPEKQNNKESSAPATEKIELCHKNHHVISVSISALAAHESHGDTSAPCPDESDDETADVGEDEETQVTFPDSIKPVFQEGILYVPFVSIEAPIVGDTVYALAFSLNEDDLEFDLVAFKVVKELPDDENVEVITYDSVGDTITVELTDESTGELFTVELQFIPSEDGKFVFTITDVSFIRG
ncbi:MAG: hypothetical protein KZQ83_11190 [gamma proteobacterium symbiont of Taylorina sp.]|nr:hypothetical protein [gamma proteobacterium symbiont of Taylorina sp.]